MNPTDLLRGEKVLATARMHPTMFLFVRPSLLLLGLLTLGLGPYLIWKYTVLYITNIRIVRRTGVLSKDLLDLDYRKLNQVQVSQSLGARLLDYGSIEFVANDQFSLDFGPLASPALLRRLVQEQVYEVAA
jgi:hypothetical protein